MTEDFKETLLTYLTGNIVQGTPSDQAVFLENETVTNNLDTYIQTELGTSSYVLEKVIQSQTNSNVVILGYKSSNYASFIVIVDKDLTPLSLITQYTSEVNFKYLTGFNVDENGYFYCIEADSMATQSNKRFLMLNNISMTNAGGEYIVKIRKSYAVPNTTVLNGSSYLVTTIIKAISQSIYLILNSNGSNRYITKLTVNVGTSNEWDDITMTGVNGVDQWASIDGEGNTYLKTINPGYPISTNVYGIGVYFYNNGIETTTTYTDDTISGLSLRRDTGIILNSTIAYVGYKLSDTNNTYTKYMINSIDLATGAIENIYTIQDVYGVYTGDYNPIVFRKIDNSVLFKITVVTDLANNKFKIITGRIVGNNVYDTTLASNLTITSYNTDFFVTTRNFNLYQYFTQLGNSYYSCKEVYNPNEYNGTEYDDYNMLIPSIGELYSNSKLVFARTLYNMQINENTTISTIEVPNDYLNEISIQPKELLGKTNLVLNSDTEAIEKNIYETVDINFMNTITIKNNDGSINQSGSNLFNNAICSSYDSTAYVKGSIQRMILNYRSGELETRALTKAMFSQTGTTGQYEFIIYVPVGEILDNIQFTNSNYMTVYNTISNLNLVGGKYYKIIQPVEVI